MFKPLSVDNNYVIISHFADTEFQSFISSLQMYKHLRGRMEQVAAAMLTMGANSPSHSFPITAIHERLESLSGLTLNNITSLRRILSRPGFVRVKMGRSENSPVTYFVSLDVFDNAGKLPDHIISLATQNIPKTVTLKGFAHASSPVEKPVEKAVEKAVEPVEPGENIERVKATLLSIDSVARGLGVGQPSTFISITQSVLDMTREAALSGKPIPTDQLDRLVTTLVSFVQSLKHYQALGELSAGVINELKREQS